MSERERGIMGTGSGKAGMGRGLVPLSGPKGSPRPFFNFYFVFFFSFSVFLILS
jgi:hypothetical protein